jgi:AraC-like DNA-binding protein
MYQVIFNTHDVVLLMTAYQCILFAILLLTIKREKPLSNFFLAFFLLQQAAIPLDILISFGAEFRHVALEWSPNLFYVFGFGYWLEAPFLLWYTRSLIYKDYRLTKKDLVYLIPFFSYLVYQVLFYYQLELQDKQHLQEDYNLFSAPYYMNYVTLFREVFRAALGVMCILEIRRYSQHIKTNFSDIERLDLTWLKILVIGFLTIRIWAVLVGLLILLSVSFGINTNFEVMGLTGNYTTFIMVSMLIFFGLGHSTVFEGIEAKSSDAVDVTKGDQLKDKIKDVQIKQVADYMEKEKPYLMPALTLDKLAAQLKMQPRILSHLINRHFACNFFEFINSYRVEESKRMLADPLCAEKNMLDLMYDVGFNSKATFNTLFKKKVGMTPSGFRKQAALQKSVQSSTAL